MIKILHLIPVHKKVSETFIWGHLENLESKIDSFVIVSSFSVKTSAEVAKGLGKDSNALMKLIYKGLIKIWSIPFFFDDSVKNQVDKYGIEIVHGHFGYYAKDILNIVTSRPAVRGVISLHGTDLNSVARSSAGLMRAIKKLLNNEKIVVVCPSFFLLKKLSTLSGIHEINNAIVLHNPVHWDFYRNRIASIMKSKFSESHSLKIVSIGRLIRCKGFDYLINAVSYLRKNGLKVNLTLVGTGPLEKELKRLVANLGIAQSVNFVGPKSRADIIEILKAACIYVQPSIRDDKTGQEESFGVAAAEAAVMGLPLIVTDAGGLSEVVNSKFPHHQIVRQASAQAIADAILYFYSLEYQISEKDIDEYASRFTPDSINKSWLRLYNSLVNKFQN